MKKKRRKNVKRNKEERKDKADEMRKSWENIRIIQYMYSARIKEKRLWKERHVTTNKMILTIDQWSVPNKLSIILKSGNMFRPFAERRDHEETRQ